MGNSNTTPHNSQLGGWIVGARVAAMVCSAAEIALLTQTRENRRRNRGGRWLVLLALLMLLMLLLLVLVLPIKQPARCTLARPRCRLLVSCTKQPLWEMGQSPCSVKGNFLDKASVNLGNLWRTQ